MAETESARVEIGFGSGQIMSALVTAASAEALETAVAGRAAGTVALDTQEGRYTVVLEHVVYVKLFAREASVGFGL